MDLVKLAQIRQERAGAKYILPSGENAAMYRDNGLDILEELADAWNIANLWEQRMRAAGIWNRELDSRLWQLRNNLEYCSDDVEAVRDILPEEFKRDLIEVERIGEWEDEQINNH